MCAQTQSMWPHPKLQVGTVLWRWLCLGGRRLRCVCTSQICPGGTQGQPQLHNRNCLRGSIPTVLEMALPILVKVFPGGAVLSPKWAQHWGHLVGRISSGDRLKWFSLSLRGMPAQGPPEAFSL